MTNYTPEEDKSQLTKNVSKKNQAKDVADMAEITETMSESVIQRMRECHSFMSFIADGEYKKRKLVYANSCGNRFCPICAWARAKKDAYKIATIMRWCEVEHKKAFIFLTLTAPNVPGNKLKESIKAFNKAFELLIKSDEVQAINKGYIRKLEVTYNQERNDYHPHFHAVMVVNKSYFTDKTYIKQSRWLELWRRSMRDETIMQVDVRRVKRESAGTETAELAKYAAKDVDMLISPKVFEDFYNGLKNRQILTFNKLVAQGNKMYKAGELNYLKEYDETEYMHMILYQWGNREYIETEKRELTSLEILRFNRQLMDEMEVE